LPRLRIDFCCHTIIADYAGQARVYAADIAPLLDTPPPLRLRCLLHMMPLSPAPALIRHIYAALYSRYAPCCDAYIADSRRSTQTTAGRCHFAAMMLRFH